MAAAKAQVANFRRGMYGRPYDYAESSFVMAVEAQTRKFKVAEFYKLAEAGILSEDDRVELLDGQIMVMAPIGESHRTVVVSARETHLLGRKRNR